MFTSVKIFFVVILLTFALLIMSACQPVAPAPAETASEMMEEDMMPAECAIEAPAEAVELNMIGWSFPIMDFYAAELEECNAVENLTVNTQLLDSTSVREQVNLALSGGGESPFAILHGANGDVPTWANDGYVQPITDLVEKYREEYNLNDIPATAWEGGSFNGEIYGVPIVANTLHLMYNMPLFEQYKLTPPTTYDEVIDVCAALADESSIDLPFTINLHAGWAWEIEFLHFFRSFGGDTYLDENSMPTINSEAGVAALSKMKEVVDACMGDLGLTYSVDDSQIGMQNGGVAFVNLWASRAAGMDDPEVSEFVGEIGFAPAPAPNPGGLLGGSAWNDFLFIPATVPMARELIFKVIMEAADQASQEEAVEYGLVTRISVSSEEVRYLAAAGETIANGVGIYQANPAVGIIRGKLGEFLPLVGTGELTPAEALEAAAKAYTDEAREQGYIQ